VVAHFTEGWELGDIHNVHIQFDNVCEISSDGGEGKCEIFKDLLCLSAEIMAANDLSCWVKSDLAGDKDGPPMCYLNNMGIAWCCRQSCWIYEAGVCWMIGHSFSLSSFHAPDC